MTKEAYKDHRAGSTKGEVHRVFDTSGKDKAIAYATKHDIQESTARTWCSTWGAGKGAKKTAKKAVAKKAPAKAAKKATAAKKAAPAKAPVAKKKARVRSVPSPATSPEA